jgi:hypothetical protein
VGAGIVLSVTVLLGAFVLRVVYRVVCSGCWGRAVGKCLLGIQVVRLEDPLCPSGPAQEFDGSSRHLPERPHSPNRVFSFTPQRPPCRKRQGGPPGGEGRRGPPPHATTNRRCDTFGRIWHPHPVDVTLSSLQAFAPKCSRRVRRFPCHSADVTDPSGRDTYETLPVSTSKRKPASFFTALRYPAPLIRARSSLIATSGSPIG